MTSTPVAIIGAGGHGREALDILLAMVDAGSPYTFAGVYDDGLEAGMEAFPGGPRIEGGTDLLAARGLHYAIGIGNHHVRELLLTKLGAERTVDLIHPTAQCGTGFKHGPGLIMAQYSVATHSVSVGTSVHVNIGCTISHDAVIGDYVTITPGVNISGSVTVGDHVWLGVGCTVINNVTIGAHTVVGAGATVVNDLQGGSTYVGTPARRNSRSE